METNGAATAAGFYLGLVDDVSPQLTHIRQKYVRLVDDIIRGNERVSASFRRMRSTIGNGAASAMSSLMGMLRGASPSVVSAKSASFELPSSRRIYGTWKQPYYSGPLRPLAKGGIVDRPTAGLVGEDGKEAIINLESGRAYLAAVFADAMSKALPKGFRQNKDIAAAIAAASHDLTDNKSLGDLTQFAKMAHKDRNNIDATYNHMKNLATSMQKVLRAKGVDFGARKNVKFFQALQNLSSKKVLTNLSNNIDGLIPELERSLDVVSRMEMSAKKAQKPIGKFQTFLEYLVAKHVLEDMQNALQNLEHLTNLGGVFQHMGDLSRTLGLSRDALTALTSDIKGTAKKDGGKAPQRKEIVEAMTALTAKGFRDFGSKLGQQLAGDTAQFLAFTGASANDASEALLGMTKQLKLSEADAKNMTAGYVLLSQRYQVNTDEMLQRQNSYMKTLQGLGLSSKDIQTQLKSTAAASAALKNSFVDFDPTEIMRNVLSDPSKMRETSVRLGISEKDLRTKGMEAMLPALQGLFQNLAKTTPGSANESGAIAQLKGLGMPALDNMDPVQMRQIAKELSNITVNYREALAQMSDPRNAKTLFDPDRINKMTGKGEQFRRFVEDLATRQIPGLNISVADITDTVQNLGILQIGQDLLGLSFMLKVVGGGLGKVGGILGNVGKRWGWFGKAASTASSTVATSTNVLTKATNVGKGPIFGFFSGLIELAGKFIGMVGKGLVVLLTSLGRGIGGLLIGVATGLAALSAPPVIIGTLVFAGIAGGLWILAEALSATAPFITALMKGLNDSLTITLTTLASMDAFQMLSVATAMPLIGGGFLAMAGGIAAGMALLGASDLSSKVSNFFGVGSGGSVAERIVSFTNSLIPLTMVLSKIQASGLAGTSKLLIPLPYFDGNMDDSQKQVLKARQIYGVLSQIIDVAKQAAQLPQSIQIPPVTTQMILEVTNNKPIAVKDESVMGVLEDILLVLKSRGPSPVTNSGMGNLLRRGNI